MEKFYMNIIFSLIFYFKLIPLAYCSFYNMKKISDNGDYFVILKDGLYIYNFEKSKCKMITSLDASIFNINDALNNIIISKNFNNNSKEIIISALINQNLYVYTISNSNINLESKKLESLVDKDKNHKTYPFSVQIINLQLIIKIIEFEDKDNILFDKYYIKSFEFNNYLSIQNNEPNIKIYKEDYTNKPLCQVDTYNSLIKCIYPYGLFGDLKYREINDSKSDFNDIIIEEESGYKYITFTFSNNKDFVCYSRNGATICFFNKIRE